MSVATSRRVPPLRRSARVAPERTKDGHVTAGRQAVSRATAAQFKSVLHPLKSLSLFRAWSGLGAAFILSVLLNDALP